MASQKELQKSDILTLSYLKTESNSQQNPINPVIIDKDKLYETFLLFQNFLQTMNQNKDIQNVNKSNNYSQIKNYDDIPIKTTNQNFIDLVEKNLATEGEYVNKSPIPKKIPPQNFSKSERRYYNATDIYENRKYNKMKKSRTIPMKIILHKGRTFTLDNYPNKENQHTNRTFDENNRLSLEEGLISSQSLKVFRKKNEQNEKLKKLISENEKLHLKLLDEYDCLKLQKINFEQEKIVLENKYLNELEEKDKEIAYLKEENEQLKKKIKEMDIKHKKSFMFQNEKKNTRSMKIFQNIKHKLFFDQINEDDKFDFVIPDKPDSELVDKKIEGKKTVKTYKDGYVIETYINGNIKQFFPDGKIIYYSNESKVTETTFANGIKVFKFSNGQIEKHFPDGRRTAIFPNGTMKYIDIDGSEEFLLINNTNNN